MTCHSLREDIFEAQDRQSTNIQQMEMDKRHKEQFHRRNFNAKQNMREYSISQENAN